MAKKKPRKKKARRKTGSDGDPRWTSRLPPAPGELRILQAFVNTADLRGGTDLAGPRALAEWLEHWGLAAPDLVLTADDLRQAKELREAVRTLVRCAPGKAPKAAARIDRAGKASPIFARLDAAGRGRLESPAESLDDALARLVAILVVSQLKETWERLRVCAHETCRAAFYDFSRNRSAVWCTVQCGNRKSALAYRWRNIESVRKMDAVRSWVRGR
jgi:predicted RNA-binding Zn ribbon-like protein